MSTPIKELEKIEEQIQILEQKKTQIESDYYKNTLRTVDGFSIIAGETYFYNTSHTSQKVFIPEKSVFTANMIWIKKEEYLTTGLHVNRIYKQDKNVKAEIKRQMAKESIDTWSTFALGFGFLAFVLYVVLPIMGQFWFVPPIGVVEWFYRMISSNLVIFIMYIAVLSLAIISNYKYFTWRKVAKS